MSSDKQRLSESEKAALLELAEKATTIRDSHIIRYSHGGGRVAITEGEIRQLIADFYDAPNREFYLACSPATIKSLLKEQKQLQEQIYAWENREAAVCPENEPFEEIIRILREKLETANAALLSREPAQPQPEWVSVKERLPDDNRCVLWCRVPICEPPVIGCIADGDFHYASDFTHWMDLPNSFWPTPPATEAEPDKEGK